MAIPSSSESGIFGDINITPLTDIFLVLLIIFMVGAAVSIESAAHVGLPQGPPAPVKPPQNVVVELTSERRILVDSHEVSLDELEPVLRTAMDKSRDKTVIFKGDPSVILGDMVIILDIATRAGARQLGIGELDESAVEPSTNQVPEATP